MPSARTASALTGSISTESSLFERDRPASTAWKYSKLMAWASASVRWRLGAQIVPRNHRRTAPSAVLGYGVEGAPELRIPAQTNNRAASSAASVGRAVGS